MTRLGVAAAATISVGKRWAAVCSMRDPNRTLYYLCVVALAILYRVYRVDARSYDRFIDNRLYGPVPATLETRRS
jgi:hypothetical protein